MPENVPEFSYLPIHTSSAWGHPADPQSLAAAHEQLARVLLSNRPLTDSLNLILRIAVEQLPGMDEASITLIVDGEPRSLVSLGRRAPRLDERQYLVDAGPGVRAAVTSTTIAVDDTTHDSIYPEYSRLAAAAGINHSLSIALPLSVPGRRAALNLYGGGDPLDSVFRTVAASFAGYVTVALTNAAVLDVALTEVEHMRKAMASRAVIEQAKGIIMSKRGCTAEEAFGRLRTVSNESNFKLRDVALDLVSSTAAGAAKR